MAARSARRWPQRHGKPCFQGFCEGGGRDSNPRPPGPQPGALPAELPPPRGDAGYRGLGSGRGRRAAHAVRLVAGGGRWGRGDEAARRGCVRGRRHRRCRVPRALDGVAAQGARTGLRRRRPRVGARRARAERPERRLRLDAVGRPADPAGTCRRHACGRRHARVRAWSARDRRVVRSRGRRRVVPRGADARRRDERGTARGVCRRDRRVRGGGRAGGGAGRSQRPSSVHGATWGSSAERSSARRRPSSPRGWRSASVRR